MAEEPNKAASQKHPPANNCGRVPETVERGAEALLLDRLQTINILSSMGESLTILSPDTEIWFVNKTTDNLLGYEPGELAGKVLGAIIADGNHEFFSALRNMITDGPIRNYKLQYLAKDGEKIPVSINGSVLREERDGKLLGMVLVAKDLRDLEGLVSELKKARDELEEKVASRTEELEKAYSELKSAHAQLLQSEKMASIGQLAAGVAHEINNPVSFLLSNLGSIESYMNDLKAHIKKYDNLFESTSSRGGLTDIEIGEITESKKELDIDFILKDSVEVIRESVEGAERVRKIVADLRDFSHEGSSEFTWADINEGVESTINIAVNETKYKATVTTDLGELPLVKCNPGELNQVFLNLIVNASHSIEKKGEIDIKTYCKNDRIFIVISDTGCGIPEENLNKIFDPFFTTKPVGKGTGLGLSLSYNIIRDHNGRIEVKSSVNEGTAFTVSLPVGPDQEDESTTK